VGVGLEPGDEVLVPAYCCAALLNAVTLAGGKPVLVDSERGGFNLCPEDAARRRTPRAKAVVVAHMFGHQAPVAPFRALGLPVVEDCAQSLGAREGEHRSGGQGDVAIGSFYATKVITTGHGGVAATSRPELLERLHDLTEYDNREDWRPRVNYGMGEIQAALGLWQLERLPRFVARRQALGEYYDARFGAVLPCHAAAPEGAIRYRYMLRVRDADTVFAALQARGIDAKRPVYRPLHHYLGGEYPHAQAAHEQIVSLPIYPTLSDAEAERVADGVLSLPREVLAAPESSRSVVCP